MQDTQDSKASDSLEHARTRMFMLMLEIGVAFAIPAILAALAGKYLDGRYGTENAWTVGSLAFAFILSWAFVIARYRAVSALLRDSKRETHTS